MALSNMDVKPKTYAIQGFGIKENIYITHGIFEDLSDEIFQYEFSFSIRILK